MRRLSLLALALILLPAACGGGGRLSKQGYEQQLKAAGKQTQAASSIVGNPSSSRTAFAKQLVTARRQMQAAADRLDGIKPPKDAEADTKAIVATLQFLADEIDKLQQAAARNDKAAAATVTADIQGSKEIAAGERAAADLKRKGYDVGVFGR
jgi:hypothetical protein